MKKKRRETEKYFILFPSFVYIYLWKFFFTRGLLEIFFLSFRSVVIQIPVAFYQATLSLQIQS